MTPTEATAAATSARRATPALMSMTPSRMPKGSSRSNATLMLGIVIILLQLIQHMRTLPEWTRRDGCAQDSQMANLMGSQTRAEADQTQRRRYTGLAITASLNHKRDDFNLNIKRKMKFEFIGSWYDSLHQFPDMKGVIINTMFNAKAQSKLTTDQVNFVNVNLQSALHSKCANRSLNDQRFFFIENYLQRRLAPNATQDEPLDYILLTDGQDVSFFRNPFEYMRVMDETTGGDPHLFVGSEFFVAEEGMQWQNKNWMECFDMPYTYQLFLNAGIIGGHVSVVLPLIQEMNRWMLPAPVPVCDQAALQLVAMTAHADRIITGYPLHTRFKEYQPQNESRAYIQHK